MTPFSLSRRALLSFSAFTLFAFSTGCAKAQVATSTTATPSVPPTSPKSLSVYFVGNSVTDTIRYESLQKLAESRGHKHISGRHMIPGAPLDWIWTHSDSGFQNEPFGLYPKA